MNSLKFLSYNFLRKENFYIPFSFFIPKNILNSFKPLNLLIDKIEL